MISVGGVRRRCCRACENEFMDDAPLTIVTADFDLDANAKRQVEGCIAAAREIFKLDLSECEGISVAEDFRGFSNQFDTGFGELDKLTFPPGLSGSLLKWSG